MCTHNQCFERMRKNIMLFHLKIDIFAAVKYCCILHGRVCVMILSVPDHCILVTSKTSETAFFSKRLITSFTMIKTSNTLLKHEPISSTCSNERLAKYLNSHRSNKCIEHILYLPRQLLNVMCRVFE